MPYKPGMTWLHRLFGARPAPHPYAAPAPDAQVTPDATRCVQCGVCGYNCPVGIPVRDFARQGQVVDDPRCVQCGQCIEACPRGTLRWGHWNDAHAPNAGEYERLMQVFFPEEGKAA